MFVDEVSDVDGVLLLLKLLPQLLLQFSCLRRLCWITVELLGCYLWGERHSTLRYLSLLDSSLVGPEELLPVLPSLHFGVWAHFLRERSVETWPCSRECWVLSVGCQVRTEVKPLVELDLAREVHEVVVLGASLLGVMGKPDGLPISRSSLASPSSCRPKALLSVRQPRVVSSSLQFDLMQQVGCLTVELDVVSGIVEPAQLCLVDLPLRVCLGVEH